MRVDDLEYGHAVRRLVAVLDHLLEGLLEEAPAANSGAEAVDSGAAAGVSAAAAGFLVPSCGPAMGRYGIDGMSAVSIVRERSHDSALGVVREKNHLSLSTPPMYPVWPS